MRASTSSGVGRTIARASITLALLSVVGLITGYLGDALLAYFFGAGSNLDAFFVSSSLYDIVSVLAGVEISALVIILAQVEREHGDDAALGIFSAVLGANIILTGLLALTVLLWPGYWMQLLAPALPGAQLSLAMTLSQVMALALVLTVVVALLSGVLNAHKHFWSPAAGGVLLNVAVVGVTVLLARRIGVAAVALATVIGLAGEIVLLGVIFHRSGFRLRRLAMGTRSYLANFVAMIGPLAIIAVLNRAYVLVERNLASGLPAGSIAVLGFASQFSTVPVVLLSGAGAPLFVFLAQQGAQADLPAFRYTVRTGLKVLYVLLVPAVGLMAALAGPLIDVFLRRGAFDATAARETTVVLSILLAGILGWVAADIGTRALWALRRFRASLLTSVLFVAMDIVLALALRDRFGVLGLAVARSAALLGYGLFTLFSLNRATQDTGSWPFVATLLRLLVAGVISAATAAAVYTALVGDGPLLWEVIAAGLGGLAGLVVYMLIVLRVFRVSEAVRLQRYGFEQLAIIMARAQSWLATAGQ